LDYIHARSTNGVLEIIRYFLFQVLGYYLIYTAILVASLTYFAMPILSRLLHHAIFIGFIGATLGIVSGIGLAYLLSASGASEGGVYIAPIFLPNELLQVWLMSLAVTMLAGLFPAWKASRLSPLIAMRV
jgi:hypothetical protein